MKPIDHGVEYRVPKSGSVLSVGSDAKTVKSLGFGYLQGVVYMAPHALPREYVRTHGGRWEEVPILCEGSTPACRAACLYRAGRGAMKYTEQCRMDRTLRALADPEGFLAALEKDLARLKRRAGRLGVLPLFRPNGTTGWQEWRAAAFSVARRVGVQAFDYSESFEAAEWYLGSETPVTLSYKGPSNLAACMRFLRMGGNVSAVYDTDPSALDFFGAPIVDGDSHDVRLPSVDGAGVVVALKLKRTVGDKAARKLRFAS